MKTGLPGTPVPFFHVLLSIDPGGSDESTFLLPLCGCTLLAAPPLFAQNRQETVSANIQHEDAVFWDAYNRCDVQEMSLFFWPDVELYHDKGGPAIGHSPRTFKE